MRLLGKVAIITGGGSGFGEGIVRKFVREGASVVIVDRDGAQAERVAAMVPGEALALTADIATREGFELAAEVTNERFGPIDILVNNAGIGHLPQPLDQLDEEIFDNITNVNMKAIYYGAQTIVPLMKERGQGVILNMASTGGVSPRPNLTWYNASKGWVITATKAMAVELAPFHIRVNAINPVAGETPLLKTFMGDDTEEIKARFLASIPLGRFSTPQDMGNAACFLCSDEASMITGIAMEVDGGRCI